MAITKSLAPELVLRIFDFVDPPTLVCLACSCKCLERLSRDLLRKHRKTSTQYRLVTDERPRSVTDVLRKAIGDPGFAWHVQVLEFTLARTGWLNWTDAETGEMMELGAVGPPDYSFTQDEQVALLNQLREVFQFNESEIDKAREDLQHGNDAPLKLLLFAVCPRIRSVKFTRHCNFTGIGGLERASSDHLGADPRSSLEYIQHAISTHVQNKASAWPVGFASLQDLAVGAGTGDETSDLAFAPSPLFFTDCMHLPNLVSLYCFGLQFRQEGTNEADNSNICRSIDKGSSSLQHMFLDNAQGQHEAMTEILSGCKQLESLTIANSELDDIDSVLGMAGECYPQSMKTLMFYETAMLHGYRCNMFRPEALQGFQDLRVVYADASDVMLDAFYNYEGDVECGVGHEWISDREFFIKYFMSFAFPESMEVLVLGTQGHSNLSEGDADHFDEAITKMIEYERGNGCDDDDDREDEEKASHGENEDEASLEENGDEDDDNESTNEHGCDASQTFERSYPNLKAIYIGALDRKSNTPARCKRWFSNAIAAGRKFGVDVHSRTTRGEPLHHVEFPRPPIPTLCAATGMAAGNSLVFDVYSGRWVLPDCGNCGRCGGCLEQYDAGVWKEIEDKLERESL
jgi:hypothetical protein